MHKQILVFIITFTLQIIVPCYAQMILDTSFGDKGVAKVDENGMYQIVIQPDGKILTLGGGNILNNQFYYILRRLNIDGSLDKTFGEKGYYIQTNQITYSIFTIKLLSNGKILIGGSADTIHTATSRGSFLLVRLNSNGSLDSSFSGDGYAIMPFIYNPIGNIGTGITSLEELSNGNIIALGEIEHNLIMARFHPDGSLDSSFGTYGKVLTTIGDYGGNVDKVFIQPDGKIVVGALGRNDTADNFMALRYLPNGNLDSSFGQFGISKTNLGAWFVYGVSTQLQPDGKILLAGYNDSTIVMRLDTNGKLDPTFGNGGIARYYPAEIKDMLLTPDGKILLGGISDSTFAIYALLPNGNLDTNFANNGILCSKQNLILYYLNNIALQPDGKLLAGGDLGKVLRFQNIPKQSFPDASGTILIFPNPFTTELHIRYTGKNSVFANINTYDVLGKELIKINHQELSVNEYKINVNNLASGMYFIQITPENGHTERYKFIKE